MTEDIAGDGGGEYCDDDCPGPAECLDTMAKKKRKCVSFPTDEFGLDDLDFCPKVPPNTRRSGPPCSMLQNCGQFPCNVSQPRFRNG